MKISCPACGANYKIPDEKVQGKNRVFKVGCKKCGAEIRVRGVATEADAGRTTMPFQMDMPEAAPTTPQRVWFAGIEGKQVGPLTEAEVQEHIGAGRLKADDLVWRKGFGAWTPVREVAPFQEKVAEVSGGASAEPVAKRKSPRRAQTLELSAAMIELLVKLDAQGDGGEGGEGEAEPPALPAGGDVALIAEEADVDEEPPPVAKAAVTSAATAAAEPPPVPASEDADPPPVPGAESDAPPAVPTGKRKAGVVALPGKAEAKASGQDEAATRVEAIPTEETAADAKAAAGKKDTARGKAGAAAAAAGTAGATATQAKSTPAAKTSGATASSKAGSGKPSVGGANPVAAGKAAATAKKDDEGGMGAGLIVGIVVVLALVGGGIFLAKNKGKGTETRGVAPQVVQPAPQAEAARIAAAKAAADKKAADDKAAAEKKAAEEKAAAEKKAAEEKAAAEKAAADAAAAATAQADAGGTETAPKAEAAVVKAEAKPSAKAEAKAETKAEAKVEKKPEAKVEAKAEKPASSGNMDEIDRILAEKKAREAKKAETKPEPTPEPPKTSKNMDDIDKLLAAERAKKQAKAMTAPQPSKKDEDDEEPSSGGAGRKMSQAEVDKIAAGKRSDVLRCYMLHGDIDAGAETIKVIIYVAAQGGVSNAKVIGKHSSDELGKCIIGAAKKLRFPQASGGTTKYTVRYAVGG
ncbi:MAG: zinc-ribbon domain-containing protein [Deltaproteobacteria bacterium]|nr:zinc-ribbon domain-containing protein [Deltaproteobacteria bacterium]